MTRETLPLERSRDWNESRERFCSSLGGWIHQCIDDFADAPLVDNHDEGTFVTPWLPYIEATGDDQAARFIIDLRDRIARHAVDSGQWHHGYWKQQEVHHGTEHFGLFLAAAWRLGVDTDETTRQMLDAAEHIGNWVESVPAWYNWQTSLFVSMYLGTEVVRTETDYHMNVPDHLRLIDLCLFAHAMSDEPRYLDLARRHATLWADALLADERLPLALSATGPLYAIDAASESAYRAFAGALGDLDSDLDRVENLLASGMLEIFLQLHGRTGEDRFLRAAERMVTALLPALPDPDATAAVHAVRLYRAHTRSDAFDKSVLDAADAQGTLQLETLSLEPFPKPLAKKPSGIGKRTDMPHWFEDNEPRRHGPALMALAAEIRGDETRAAEALDLARAHFDLARRVYPSGREHGCGSRTVSAVARGNGRENRAGMVSAVFEPLLRRFSPA